MVNWYIKGQSDYISASFHMGFYIDHSGFAEGDYDTQDMETHGATSDPFMAFGIDTGPATWTYGQQQVEIGLLKSHRLKFDTTGSYKWVGPGQDDWAIIEAAGSAGNLGDLDDVVITGTPAEDEVLAWDTGSSKWINQTGGEAGLALASALHTEDHDNTHHTTNYHTETAGTGVVTVHSDITSVGSGIIITTLERDALHTIVVAGDLNHNDLANIDADDIKHITATQLGNLHAIYTLEQHDNSFHSTNYHTESDGTGVVTVHSDITSAGSGAIITTGERNDLHAAVTQVYNLKALDDRDFKPNTADTYGFVKAYFTTLGGMTGVADTNYQDLLILNSYSDGSGGDMNALTFDKSEMLIKHWFADQGAATWGTPKIIAYTEDLHPKQHAMDAIAEHTRTDIAVLDATTNFHGFLKKLSGTSTEYMNGVGNWATPPDTGDTKEVSLQHVEDTGLVLSAGIEISSADQDLDFNFGRTSLGDKNTYGDWALLAYIDMIGIAGSYAIRQNPTGETYINSATAKNLYLCINNAGLITINATNMTMAIPIAMGGDKITGLGASTVAGDAVRHEDSRLSDARDANGILTKTFTEGGGDLVDADIMVYRTSTGKWELEEKPAGGSNPAMNDITDVTITSIGNNDIIGWDGVSKYTNQTAAELGLSTTSHTHSSIVSTASVVCTTTITSASTGSQYITVDATRRWYWSGSDYHLRPYAGNTYDIGDATNDVRYLYYCNLSDTSCADFSHLSAEELYNLFKQIQPRTDDIKHKIDNGMLFNHIDFATLPDEFANKAKKDFTKENVSTATGITTIDYNVGDNCGIEKGTWDYAMKDLLVKQYEMIKALELRIIELEK